MEMDYEFYDLLEHAIDNAFEGQMNLKLYDYLHANRVKKSEVDAFNRSSTFFELTQLIKELDEYLEGGSDSNHQQVREGYRHISKPQARKIRTYLYGILEDARRYSRDRRPGRKKNPSK